MGLGSLNKYGDLTSFGGVRSFRCLSCSRTAGRAVCVTAKLPRLRSFPGCASTMHRDRRRLMFSDLETQAMFRCADQAIEYSTTINATIHVEVREKGPPAS